MLFYSSSKFEFLDFGIFFSFFRSFMRCRLYIWKMELYRTQAKKGDGIQKFTYRCDMGAHAHIVPQLFIVMTSTISNYSLIYIQPFFFIPVSS